MRRFVLFLLCWAGMGLAAYPQRVDAHKLLFLAHTGYSRILVPDATVATAGGLGLGAGVGYEYQHGQFLLQTGLGFQRITSAASISSFDHNVPMQDTENRFYEGIFEFRNNRERQTLWGVTLPVMVGADFRRFYFLAGAKVLFNLGGYVLTESDVTSKARYDMIVGSDGDGLLADMPNHGLTTHHRSLESRQPFAPVWFVSCEVGKTFRPSPARRHRTARAEYYRNVMDGNRSFRRQLFCGHTCRVALFCDYGFGSLTGRVGNAAKIVNTATCPQAYQPALNHTSYATGRFHALYVGVKCSLLLEFTECYPCRGY